MNFRTLYDQSPQELKDIVMSQWKAKQNPKWHPEGNTLKHIITVTNRAFKYFPDNPHIQLAAYFHDLGKLATSGVNPKTGQPTAYGHENEGVNLVDRYENFITKMGADPDIVRYIVKNHMKIKPRTWDVMKQKKKDPIINDPSFDDLMKFGDIDKGGLNLQEKMKLKDILNEVTISRNIEIDIIDNDIMIKQGDRVNGKLVKINIAYVGMSDRIYRGYLFVDDGGPRPQQINLSGGENGLFEFYDAVGAGRGAEARDFFEEYGVKIETSEFDVS